MSFQRLPCLRRGAGFQRVENVAMLIEDVAGIACEIDISRMGLRQDALMPGADHRIVAGENDAVVKFPIELQRGGQVLQRIPLEVESVLVEVPGKLVQ